MVEGPCTTRLRPTDVMQNGTKAIKPMLQRLYKLRAENFRDALKACCISMHAPWRRWPRTAQQEFTVGYREGMALGQKRAEGMVDELITESRRAQGAGEGTDAAGEPQSKEKGGIARPAAKP